MISDIVSQPFLIADLNYISQTKNLVTDSVTLSRQESKDCPMNGHTYKFIFKGDIFQDGIPKKDWTKTQLDHFNANKDRLYAECDFQYQINGKNVFPFISGELETSETDIEVRY